MKKMENSRWAAGVIVLLIVLNMVTLSYLFFQSPARPFEGERMGKNDPVYIFFRDEIGFDEAQMATFEQMRAENRLEMRQHHQTMRKLKNSFFGLLATAESATADSLAGEIGQLHTRIDMTVFKHFSGLREICNEEQKIRFDQLIEDLLHRSRPHQGPPGR
ncbi:MAG: periplasmic heavy metal sensor [Bacteroidia bacterium]|nr:periplasmic heavy metal sensor [Bacteroidia bacterium]